MCTIGDITIQAQHYMNKNTRAALHVRRPKLYVVTRYKKKQYRMIQHCKLLQDTRTTFPVVIENMNNNTTEQYDLTRPTLQIVTTLQEQSAATSKKNKQADCMTALLSYGVYFSLKLRQRIKLFPFVVPPFLLLFRSVLK